MLEKGHAGARERFSSLILTSAFFLLLATSAEAAKGEKTAWYVVRFSNVPVGFARECWRAGASSYSYQFHLEIKVSRMGTPMDLLVDEEETDGIDGRIDRYFSQWSVSGTVVKASGVLRGDTLYVRTETQGSSQNESILWEKGAVGRAVLDSIVRSRLRGGEKDFSVRAFSADRGAFETFAFRAGEARLDTIDGVETKILRVEQFEGGGEVPLSFSWLDESYELVRATFQLMGVEVSFERVDEEEVRSLVREPNFDIIRHSMIRCRGLPDSVGGLQEVTYRLRFSYPLREDKGFFGPNQLVLKKDSKVLELLVSRSTLFKEPLLEDSTYLYLKPGPYIQSENARIKAIADSLAEWRGKRGWELALEAAGWVNGYIEHKSLEKGFAPASEVLRTREGDCTEHAVLLAAILRALGIPSRLAIGFIYTGGYLVGHMWTEAYVGSWRTLDATEPGLSPRRIRFAHTRGKDPLRDRDLIETYRAMGNLKVEVIAYSSLRRE